MASCRAPAIHPFDESLEHRRVLPYNPKYTEIYQAVKILVETRCDGVEFVHIGSTAVDDLRGKPMVDLLAVTGDPELRRVQAALEMVGFHRRAVWTDTDDKPYVCGSVRRSGGVFNVNIHVCNENSPRHHGLVKFRDILRNHEQARRRYEKAKDDAHSVSPGDARRITKQRRRSFERSWMSFAPARRPDSFELT